MYYYTDSKTTDSTDWQLIGGLTGVGIFFLAVFVITILSLIWKSRLARPGDYFISYS